jgi:hypothetical protein
MTSEKRKGTIKDLIDAASEKTGDYQNDDLSGQTQHQESMQSREWKDHGIEIPPQGSYMPKTRQTQHQESMQSRKWKDHGIEIPPQGSYMPKTRPTNTKQYVRWTAEEDDIIIREINNDKKRFAARSSDKLEGRDAASVWNRWNHVLKDNTDLYGLLDNDYTPEQRKHHIKTYGTLVKYTPEERKQAIKRWKEKKQKRNASNDNRYKVRKYNANTKKRVKGRFASKEGGKKKGRKTKIKSLKKRRKTRSKK